jgi:hypothetical protein
MESALVDGTFAKRRPKKDQSYQANLTEYWKLRFGMETPIILKAHGNLNFIIILTIKEIGLVLNYKIGILVIFSHYQS